MRNLIIGGVGMLGGVGFLLSAILGRSSWAGQPGLYQPAQIALTILAILAFGVGTICLIIEGINFFLARRFTFSGHRSKMKMTIKSVGLFSMAKISAAFGIIVGFIYGIIIFLAILLPAVWSQRWASLPLALAFAGLFFILSPVVFAVVGFIQGILSALVYNLAAQLLGGIELNMSKRSSGKRAREIDEERFGAALPVHSSRRDELED